MQFPVRESELSLFFDMIFNPKYVFMINIDN